jgi:hypothetical protein
MPEPTTVLVIGVHREELAFGERVAAGLSDLPITVYCIPEGISGRHPRQDQLFRYRLYHEELYLQLRQQLKAGTRLLIDLHAGQDSAGPAADLFCRDRALLDCIDRAPTDQAGWGPSTRVRTIRLVDAGPEPGGGPAAIQSSAPVAHALIPRRIWRRQPPLYVAVECYLREPGAGEPEDWALAGALIRRLLACHQGGRIAAYDAGQKSSGGR